MATLTKTPTVDLKATFLDQFTAQEKADGQRPALRRLRKAAISRFAELGFPGSRDEEWRFTPVAPLLKVNFTPAPEAAAVTEAALAKLSLDLPECSRLVLVNGRYRPELSRLKGLPPGAFFGSLAQALDKQPELVETHLGRIARMEQQTFTALNTALFTDGLFIYLPAGVSLSAPLHLIHVSQPGGSPSVSQLRLLVVAEAGSQGSLVESFVGEAISFTNAVAEVSLGEGAIVEHTRLQRESGEAFHVGALHVRIAARANYKNLVVNLGGQWVRNDFTATLEGPNCECTLNGLTLADGHRLIDNHTTIDHAQPNCNSHELYKNVIRDHGKVVFNGKIMVRQIAQKTDAKQTNQTLLLSDDGQINTKPQLEIFADDVKCTHGATVGQLEEEALFYLRSRGIDLAEAKSLLTFAFANDLIERLQVPSLRQALEAHLLHEEHLEEAVGQRKEGT